MLENKLISLFRTISHEEYRVFVKFLNYKYTGRSSYQKLFHYLMDHFKRVDEKSFDYNNLHKEHFQSLSRKSFQNILSDASKLVEEFLIWQELQNSTWVKDLLLLSSLKERGLYKLFDKKASHTIYCLDTGPQGVWNSLALLLIDHLQYFSDNPVKIEKAKEMLDSLLQHFEAFTRTQSLFYQSEVVNRTNWQNESWEDQLLKLELNTTSTNKLELLLNHLVLIQSGSLESFSYLKDILINKAASVNKELQQVILIHLLKYLTVNIEDTKIRGQEMLKLFSYGLESGLFHRQQKLPPIRFHNIVDTACRLQEFKWVDVFINSSKPHLSENSWEDTIKLAQAQVFFAQIDRVVASNGVIDLLHNRSFSNTRQEIRARTMLLCSYFEALNERRNTEFVKNAVTTYKRFIDRSKDLTKNEYLSLANLVHYIRLLLRKKNLDYSTLMKEVSESKIFFKSWLIARMKERQPFNKTLKG